jgi:hypothetical protein
MNKETAVLVSVGAVGVAGAGWGLWRMSERKSLVGMFEADPSIATLRAGYKALGAPAGMEWIKDGAFEEKAAELLPWFELSTAADVFPEVLKSLKPLKESPQAQKGLEVVRDVLKSAGIDLPKGTDAALQTIGNILGVKKGKGGVKTRPGMG